MKGLREYNAKKTALSKIKSNLMLKCVLMGF